MSVQVEILPDGLGGAAKALIQAHKDANPAWPPKPRQLLLTLAQYASDDRVRLDATLALLALDGGAEPSSLFQERK